MHHQKLVCMAPPFRLCVTSSSYISATAAKVAGYHLLLQISLRTVIINLLAISYKKYQLH